MQKNKPLTTTYTFLDWNKTNLEKNTTNRLPKSSEIWNFDCQLLPLTFFCISYFWKMEKQNRKMSVNEFIIQYCTLWKITYSNFKRFAQNCKKNTAYISFSIYLSLKSPPLLSGYMACPCAFLLRYYLDRSLEEILSKFYSNPIHRPWWFSDQKSSPLPNRYRSDLKSVCLLCFSRCI